MTFSQFHLVLAKHLLHAGENNTSSSPVFSPVRLRFQVSFLRLPPSPLSSVFLSTGWTEKEKERRKKDILFHSLPFLL